MFVMVPLVFFINGMTKGDWLEVKRINFNCDEKLDVRGYIDYTLT